MAVLSGDGYSIATVTGRGSGRDRCHCCKPEFSVHIIISQGAAGMWGFLLLQRIPEEELLLFCHQKVQELADYDRVHNTELCVTLQVYLEQTKSLVHTAEILFIHRNTVRYRVNKCMELMGTQFNDGSEVFSYILSLRMLEYKTKILKQ